MKTQEGNLNEKELQEYKELLSIPAHLCDKDQLKRRGELNGKASYWDMVAVSPPSAPTKEVLGSLRNVKGELRAYSASAHYGDEAHSGVDPDNDGSDSDTFYYFIPEDLQQKAQKMIDDEETDHGWIWITVKTAPLGEPAGPVLAIAGESKDGC